MLLSGKAEYETRTKEFAMMEATEIEKTSALPSPRLLNTHVPVSMLPRQVKDKKVKVMHVYRNVKDVVVSMYFHLSQNKGMENSTIETMIQMMFREEKADNVLFFFRKAGHSIAQTADEFRLAESGPAELVADACSFHKMKEADKTKDQLDHLPRNQMYRKGEVGDWKNHLTVAQSERLDALMKDLEGCDFRFRYTL
nr:hypothetical protein BaRGS_026702 [Batillaria attramentaria]